MGVLKPQYHFAWNEWIKFAWTTTELELTEPVHIKKVDEDTAAQETAVPVITQEPKTKHVKLWDNRTSDVNLQSAALDRRIQEPPAAALKDVEKKSYYASALKPSVVSGLRWERNQPYRWSHAPPCAVATR